MSLLICGTRYGGSRVSKTTPQCDELKPCPFCGGNQIYMNIGIYIGKTHESVTIKCDDCGASIWGVTDEKAIIKWNRRAD
jgi:Lar family restriction alleviation protein